MVLGSVLALAFAGYLLRDSLFPSSLDDCSEAADYHLAQAETDPNNATIHHQAAENYLLAEAMGHSCTWPPEQGAP